MLSSYALRVCGRTRSCDPFSSLSADLAVADSPRFVRRLPAGRCTATRPGAGRGSGSVTGNSRQNPGCSSTCFWPGSKCRSGKSNGRFRNRSARRDRYCTSKKNMVVLKTGLSESSSPMADRSCKTWTRSSQDMEPVMATQRHGTDSTRRVTNMPTVAVTRVGGTPSPSHWQCEGNGLPP